MSIVPALPSFARAPRPRLAYPHVNRGIITRMSSDDRQTSAPPVVTAAPDEHGGGAGCGGRVSPARSDHSAAARHTRKCSWEGLRYLQQRIPEFTQLSVQEKRSHARAANLDPEFIESGLHAAAVWRDTKIIVQRER